MSTPSSGSTGNGAGGERFDIPGNLAGVSEVQHQLTIPSRQMGQLALRFIHNGWQLMEEAVHADDALQAAQNAEEERRKGREVQRWNARISS